jgi:hypothetical protein
MAASRVVEPVQTFRVVEPVETFRVVEPVETTRRTTESDAE